MRRVMTRRGVLALCLLALIGAQTGCQHYRASTSDWQADEHRPVRQWAEVPLGLVLGAPATLFALALYPFELDKARPSFVELAGITAIAVDPSRTLVER